MFSRVKKNFENQVSTAVWEEITWEIMEKDKANAVPNCNPFGSCKLKLEHTKKIISTTNKIGNSI